MGQRWSRSEKMESFYKRPGDESFLKLPLSINRQELFLLIFSGTFRNYPPVGDSFRKSIREFIKASVRNFEPLLFLNSTKIHRWTFSLRAFFLFCMRQVQRQRDAGRVSSFCSSLYCLRSRHWILGQRAGSFQQWW